MPLRDHCRPPLSGVYPWSSISTALLAEFTRNLNRILPHRFFAIENRTISDGTDIGSESFEVKVFVREGRSKLVGAIELVSPSNKDRPSTRQAFISKCASYLSEGVCVVVLDATTERPAQLHQELLELFGQNDEDNPNPTMFAAAYRPVLRNEKAEVDIWVEPVAVGDPLPTMPLRLTGDLMVPVDFETAYIDVCRDRRVI